MAAMSASHSRAADSTSVSSTVCRSNVERLITLSTSAVAVCCCRRFAQLVEQPRVLDRDDGLGGEVLNQLDLLVGERPDLLAVDGDRADQLVILEHRHRQGATVRLQARPMRARPGPPPQRRQSMCTALCLAARRQVQVSGGGMNRSALFDRIRASRRIVHGAQRCPEQVAVVAAQTCQTWHRKCVVAFSSMASNTGSKFAGRAGDDLQHLGGRGLLLSS